MEMSEDSCPQKGVSRVSSYCVSPVSGLLLLTGEETQQ